MQRFAVSVAYVGSRFSGWAAQTHAQHVETVCGAIDGALDRLVGQGNHCGAVVSSRTDKGVHAIMNTFHVDVRRGPREGRMGTESGMFTSEDIVGGLNAHLMATGYHNDISIQGAVATDEENFHARFSAKGREYVYKIVPCTKKKRAGFEMGGFKESSLVCGHRAVPGAPLASPLFQANRAWCLEGFPDLAVGAMEEASQHLVGKFDFTSLRGPDCQAESPVKEVSSVSVDRLAAGPSLGHPMLPGSLVLVTVRAPRFLHRMVRNIAGLLVAVGKGDLPPGAVPGIIEARDRRRAPACAPPHGLYLSRVWY